VKSNGMQILQLHAICSQASSWWRRALMDRHIRPAYPTIEAAVRANQRDVALSLAHERLGIRPRSAPNRRFLRHAEAIAA